MKVQPQIIPEPVSRHVRCLDPEAVYLSPSGRRCRVSVSVRDLSQNKALLVYDQPDGSAPGPGDFSDGFVLARANWHLLRKVG